MIKVDDTVKFTNMDIEYKESCYYEAMKKYLGEVGIVIEVDYEPNEDSFYNVKFADGKEWCLDNSEVEKGKLVWVAEDEY